ncbi:hypothetical protein TKK_0012897 [Trichogramma kaykai]|uniref:SANT domain-containing protein n=1 Tax=Trichogramma kaykai TaxID=54128 RepID=A0ABD2WL59_9HYME
MTSVEKEDETIAIMSTPEKSNVTLEDPSTSTSKDENVNEDKEENLTSPGPTKSSVSSDIPINGCIVSSDSKNANVKIVRGSKRKANSDSTDKRDGKDDPEAEAKRSLKRTCELWSMEDKETFFKAINEYGKDFDALQTYFLIQGKKKGMPEKMIKNKEQIRHFYYRTWLKISKHLKFSEEVKKTSQELYGLINYGELRRKLPRMHEKVQMKLNELVYYGYTQVRLRGKTMRIKTPICRALRKLNRLEGWAEDLKLPSRVTVELRPGNNLTWWNVQTLAMNPRVRTLVPIQRRLSSILLYLQHRWRPWKPKNNADMDNLINNDAKSTKILRVAPPTGCKITLPAVNLGEYLTSNSVSLNSYENRLGLKSSRVELLGSSQNMKSMGKKGLKKFKGDLKRLNSKSDDVPDSSDIDQAESSIVSSTEKLNSSKSIPKPLDEQHTEPGGFPGRETIERIRLGWNVDEINTITVGDLFLMFGRDSKVVLEYWWETPQNDALGEKSNVVGNPQKSKDSLTASLQKLLSIAKHSFCSSKGYDNVSGSNETVISSRIPSTKESTFVRPVIPLAYHKMGGPEAFKTQLDKYRTKFGRRGRIIRQRNLVVQRVLPVTPKTALQTTTIEPQQQQQQPISYGEVHNISVGTSTKTVTLTILPSNDISPIHTISNEQVQNNNLENTQKHFLGVLDNGTVEPPKVANSNSSITSAMQILKEGEQQWLNSEVADFSLSSFLGQLESPIKASSQRSQTEIPMIEIIRPPSEAANMHCIMNENSVDYTAKFTNFASQNFSSASVHKK